MTYSIHFTSAARKQFVKLIQTVRKRLDKQIMALAENPRPKGMKVLKGQKDLCRVRVGDYRIIYQIQDQVLVILVVKIGSRGDVYKGL